MKLFVNIKKSIAAIIIFGSSMLFSCSDEIPKINRITSKEDLPTISMDIFKTTLTEEGKIKGKLKAKRLERYDDVLEPNIKFPKGISVVFFDENGALESSLTANSAIYYNKKESWEAMGNVVFTNINGQVLRTEHLYGDQKNGKIYTDEFVQITSANGNLIKGAAGFESNTNFTIYKFLDVSGKIAIEDNPESETDSISKLSVPKTREKPTLKGKLKKHNIPKKPSRDIK